MLRIIKISGESMSPEYHDGDYVVTSRLPLLLGLVKINSVVVFKSEKYGPLIKKVSSIDKKEKRYFFSGSNSISITTEEIGAIYQKNIYGSVIFHIKK